MARVRHHDPSKLLDWCPVYRGRILHRGTFLRGNAGKVCCTRRSVGSPARRGTRDLSRFAHMRSGDPVAANPGCDRKDSFDLGRGGCGPCLAMAGAHADTRCTNGDCNGRRDGRPFLVPRMVDSGRCPQDCALCIGIEANAGQGATLNRPTGS